MHLGQLFLIWNSQDFICESPIIQFQNRQILYRIFICLILILIELFQKMSQNRTWLKTMSCVKYILSGIQFQQFCKSYLSFAFVCF